MKTLSRAALEQSARDLGLWDNGKIAVEHEDHLAVVADYAVYEYRAGGKSAVERFADRPDALVGSDEHSLLNAMREARFTLVEILQIVPNVGVRALDHIYGRRLMLADVELSQTAKPGVVLATRLLSLPTFAMTSGAPLAFDRELAAFFLRGVGGGLADLRLLPRRERKHLARHLIGLAMDGLGMVTPAPPPSRKLGDEEGAMGARKKTRAKVKKTAKGTSGRGLVKTRGKPGSKRVVVTAPKAKKAAPRKRAKKRKKTLQSAKSVSRPNAVTAVPTVVTQNKKPIVVMEAPPDE